MTPTIEFIDTTTRDGNQSLWSATGLTTPDVMAIAPTLDGVGYHALDFTSSTHMAVSVRFHQEDPWERIRRVSAAMPDTPLGMITPGMRFISWVPAGEDVMRLAFRLVARNGIRRLKIADPSNEPSRIRRLAAMARQEGIEETVVGLTYSVSEVHTHDYYAQRAAALADCPDMDRMYLKDPGGLLTPAAVRELAPHLLDAAGTRPLELHSHCTIGLAPLVYVEGVQAGFGVVHTACGPLSRGTSQPDVVSTARNLEASGYGHDLDLERQAVVAEHFFELARAKGLPAGAPREFDAAYYRHQLPGGMVTTTRRMLEEMRRGELFDEVLEEVTRVRAEMGYPIIVTPVSQFIASQAAHNVIDGERWRTVSDETVRYFLGHYGDPPAAVDQQIADRVLARPQAAKLGELEPLSLEGARERFGRRISEEELLLRLTMPAEQVDAMIAARDGTDRGGNGSRYPLPAARPGRSPLVTLLRELQQRESITSAEIVSGSDRVVWRRA
jgi:oxaloacetate decarboxylase (Na+ extruding) subunit alpha